MYILQDVAYLQEVLYIPQDVAYLQEVLYILRDVAYLQEVLYILRDVAYLQEVLYILQDVAYLQEVLYILENVAYRHSQLLARKVARPKRAVLPFYNKTSPVSSHNYRHGIGTVLRERHCYSTPRRRQAVVTIIGTEWAQS